MLPSTPPPLPGIVHTDVRVDRHRWHVATAGEGPPVVLLHGWPQHWWAWRKVVPELAKSHRVYVPDLRGFGWSDAPEGAYSKMGLACDIERLLDVLEIDDCALVGHDWGGFAAQLTAIRAPERVERLAVFSIVHPWIKAGGDKRAALRTVYQVPLATPVLGEWLQRLGPVAVRELLRRGAGPDYHWRPEDLRLYADAFRRRDHARAASALYRTFLTRELPALLRGRYRNRRLTVPTLYATGEHDPVVSPARLAGAEQYVDDVRVEVIEGAGHFVAEEKPTRVVELIRRHLR